MLSEFHDIVPELMPKFGVCRLVLGGGRLGGWGWRFGGGGGGGGGVGGGRASCVLFLMFFYLY